MKANKTKIIGILGIAIILALYFNLNRNESEGEAGDTKKKTETVVPYIAGIEPVDVYLNFEKQGFSKKESFNSEYGNSWTNTKNENSIHFTVVTFSDNATNVINVRGTATISGDKKIEATKFFFKFLGSLPFDGNDPNKVAVWVDENITKDFATIQLGDVQITLRATSPLTRVMEISNRI